MSISPPISRASIIESNVPIIPLNFSYRVLLIGDVRFNCGIRNPIAHARGLIDNFHSKCTVLSASHSLRDQQKVPFSSVQRNPTNCVLAGTKKKIQKSNDLSSLASLSLSFVMFSFPPIDYLKHWNIQMLKPNLKDSSLKLKTSFEMQRYRMN